MIRSQLLKPKTINDLFLYFYNFQKLRWDDVARDSLALEGIEFFLFTCFTVKLIWVFREYRGGYTQQLKQGLLSIVETKEIKTNDQCDRCSLGDPNWESWGKISSKSLPKSFSLRQVFIHKIVTDISFSSPSAFYRLHVSTLPFPKRKHCFSFSKFAVLLFLVTKFLPGIWVEHLFSPFSKNTFLTQNRNCLQVVQAFKSSIFHSYFFFFGPFSSFLLFSFFGFLFSLPK